ncbi:MAG: oxidoreductase-like domain-containing protein [Burkholderiales bacterium]
MLPPRPQPPAPGDCCGGGCALCVFDLYERELEQWRQRISEIEARERKGG